MLNFYYKKMGLTMKKLSFIVVVLMTLIVFDYRPSYAMFGSNSGILSGILSENTIRTVKQAVQTIQMTVSAINQAEALYYETESLINQLKNISSFQSILLAGEQMQSIYMNLDSAAYQVVDQYDISHGITPDYQQQQEEMQNLGEEMMLTSSLAGSAADIANIRSQAANAQGFALLNGASMGAQAALTTTQAVDNLLSYEAQKDGLHKMQAKVQKTLEEQNKASSSLRIMKVPCANRNAFVTVVGTLSTNNIECTQTGFPRPILITNSPVGTGINSSIRNSLEMSCAQSQTAATIAQARAAFAGVSGTPQPPINCSQITPPALNPPTPTPPQPFPPPMSNIGPPLPFQP